MLYWFLRKAERELPYFWQFSHISLAPTIGKENMRHLFIHKSPQFNCVGSALIVTVERSILSWSKLWTIVPNFYILLTWKCVVLLSKMDYNCIKCLMCVPHTIPSDNNVLILQLIIPPGLCTSPLFVIASPLVSSSAKVIYHVVKLLPQIWRINCLTVSNY